MQLFSRELRQNDPGPPSPRWRGSELGRGCERGYRVRGLGSLQRPNSPLPPPSPQCLPCEYLEEALQKKNGLYSASSEQQNNSSPCLVSTVEADLLTPRRVPMYVCVCV